MKNFYDLSQVNILITGSSGLLGSTYCKYFLKQGAHVIGIDKSIDYKKFNLLSSEKKNLSLFECDITKIVSASRIIHNFVSVRGSYNLKTNFPIGSTPERLSKM